MARAPLPSPPGSRLARPAAPPLIIISRGLKSFPRLAFRWSFPDAFSFPDPHRGEGTLGVHEMRYVASVRIANKSLGGTFDWLLLGDDDTARALWPFFFPARRCRI